MTAPNQQPGSRGETPPPRVVSLPIGLASAPHVSSFSQAELRPLPVDVSSPPVSLNGLAAVSIPIRERKPKIHSFRFGRRSVAKPQTTAAGQGGGTPAQSKAKSGTITRFRPPRDVIKLADRLDYLLQPPLESVLHGGELPFPFEPFPYQYEGVAFLFPRVAAVLADEMGLGKTMQAITTIRLLLHSGEAGRVLLVCPKPLVTNWKREFALWAPEIPVMIVEGSGAKRQWQWRLDDVPVRIANYELVLRDRELVNTEENHFDLVVLDEAQRIKNRGGTTSQVIRGIPRRRSWALTGTPIENSTEDLVGIFEFLSPGYLHSGMSPRQISRSVRDYTLRRTKDQVLKDLPPKLFRDVDIDLTPAQRASYQAAEEQGVVELGELGGQLTIQHVFELVLRLKQICNFDPATGESAKLERLAADMEEVAASGAKAIVFSQWVEVLTKLRDRLQRFGPLEYHGRIPSARRDGVIDRFKQDKNCRLLLMSYGAGSVGLNLQFCNYVFLFDRWWNPAVEDQAINRAHRIGVDGPVWINRFTTLGTIEQRIDQILANKRELFDTIFSGEDDARHLGLNQAEVFGLFNLKLPGREEKAA